GLRSAGFSAEAFAGQPVSTLFCTPSAIDAHQKALMGESALFHVDIGGHSLEAQLEPITGANGSISGVVGLALDSTERLMAETALRLSELSYRSLIEEAPYAMCRATESGQLLQVNRAMLEMLGYDPANEAELLVRDLPLIYVSPEGYQALLAGLE